jgi:hypothetical protein
MITPGGVSCPACGWELTTAMAIVSIVLGVLGFASRAVESRVASQRISGAQIDAKANLHG